MHPVFASIQFGPFASAYHSGAMTPEFKEALGAFLEKELLPQVEQPFESTSGTLVAAYDDERYCGPNSAVRDICRYGARPPFSLERLALLPDGRIATRLRRPRRNGATLLVLEPIAFMARLAALIPPPR